MPNIKSAIKRVKTTDKRRAQNIAVKSALRTSVKKFESLVEAGDVESAVVAHKEATKKIDKAATKGLIHKNTASRQKSRLTKKLNVIQTA